MPESMGIMRELKASVAALLSIGMVLSVSSGCFSDHHSVPELSASSTGEDHLERALLYQKRAHQMELEALKYETEAERITLAEDPKGFRRNGLRIAAAEHHREAKDLLAQAETHRRIADRLFERQHDHAAPP